MMEQVEKKSQLRENPTYGRNLKICSVNINKKWIIQSLEDECNQKKKEFNFMR